MKKITFITLLSISITAIAFSSAHSQKSNVGYVYTTNIADTTPKTQHAVMKKKTTHVTDKKTAKQKTPKDSTSHKQ